MQGSVLRHDLESMVNAWPVKLINPPPYAVASAAVCSKAMVLLVFILCLLLILLFMGFVPGFFFAMQYFVSFLALQSLRWGSESWILYF